jgi:hypothetical protein
MKRDEFTRRTKDQAYASDRNRKSRINFRNAAGPEAHTRPHKSIASGFDAARKRSEPRLTARRKVFRRKICKFGPPGGLRVGNSPL